tara:strand:- start:893 stop:1099 length:207 start_codon:yes stop_codon:yes gene_type:complete
MELALLLLNRRYHDMSINYTNHSTFNDLKSCIHPDPDVICLDCDCWKNDPFKDSCEEFKIVLDNPINS